MLVLRNLMEMELGSNGLDPDQDKNSDCYFNSFNYSSDRTVEACNLTV